MNTNNNSAGAVGVLEQAKVDASDYGYSIDEAGFVHTRSGKKTGVRIGSKKGRLRAEREDGSLLWSGPRIGNFLESFWFAVREARRHG